MKNESSTLPRLVKSLEEYQNRGGKIYVLDTGSTDNSIEIAKQLGCIVFEGDPKDFNISITEQTANAINEDFIVDNEGVILEPSVQQFHYAYARNYIASKSEENFIFMPDCDEVFTNFDIDAISELITSGAEQIYYNYIFSHQADGSPAIQFNQSKAYDKRKLKWVNIVHEVLEGYAHTVTASEDVITLDHYQNRETNRGHYLQGLALDAHMNPTNDRQSHYLGRELYYTGRYNSAIKEFLRHTTISKWPVEKAQSLTFIGDCYNALNNFELAVEYYNKSIMEDASRREAFVKLALLYRFKMKHQAAIAYANAALSIPYTPFYQNDISYYTYLPHDVLYISYGWLGDVEKAKEHLTKALEYQPYNPVYLANTMYYFEYPMPDIPGWMRWSEMQWLNEKAKTYKNIAEIGSWKGRSTHALLSSNKSTVTAIDTWKGSDDSDDLTNAEAKTSDILEEFKKNVGHFENLVIHQGESIDAAKTYADKSFDMVFIDANHKYEFVKADIDVWLPKTKSIISGHDYDEKAWPGVVEAVNNTFGKPTGVDDSIWYVQLDKPTIPKKIFTIWLSFENVPEAITKIVNSQFMNGYQHNFVTMREISMLLGFLPEEQSDYIRQGIHAQQWKKVANFLKGVYLYNYGGIFLDPTVEILENKTFDNLLYNNVFACKDKNDYMSMAAIGAIQKHPLLKSYINYSLDNFRGDDDQVFQSGVESFTKLYYADKTVAAIDSSFITYEEIKDNTIGVNKIGLELL